MKNSIKEATVIMLILVSKEYAFICHKRKNASDKLYYYLLHDVAIEFVRFDKNKLSGSAI